MFAIISSQCFTLEWTLLALFSGTIYCVSDFDVSLFPSFHSLTSAQCWYKHFFSAGFSLNATVFECERLAREYLEVCVHSSDIRMNQKSMLCMQFRWICDCQIVELLLRCTIGKRCRYCAVVLLIRSSLLFFSIFIDSNSSQWQMIRANSVIRNSWIQQHFYIICFPPYDLYFSREKERARKTHTVRSLVSLYMWKYLASGEWMILNGNLISKQCGWQGIYGKREV